MLEFLEQHFGAAIHAAGSIYIVLGIVLMCFKVPGTPDYAPYRLSKKLLALSLWLTSANVYLWLFTFTGNWNANDPWVACFDIIFYYAISITLTFSFSNLLDRNYITKRRCITSLTKFGITTLIAISSQLEVLKEYQQWLLLIALLGLIEYFTKFMIYFRKTYARSGELFDNYFSTDKRHFISWIKHSLSLLYLLGVIAILTINTGAIVNWLFQVYIISVMVYTAISFINYAAEYGTLQKADTEPTAEEAQIKADLEGKTKPKMMTSQATGEQATNTQATGTHPQKEGAQPTNANYAYMENLKPRVVAWIGSKNYLKEQFTIEDLAALLATNKYYLSRFIKENYDMNFSTWISSLRLEEAKRLMQSDKNMKLEDIAFAVGFSSLSYFSKVFSRLEGTTPSAWLRERMR